MRRFATWVGSAPWVFCLTAALGCSHSTASTQTTGATGTSTGSPTTSAGTTSGSGTSSTGGGTGTSSAGGSTGTGASTGGIGDGGDGGCGCPQHQFCDPLDAGNCLVCLHDSDCGQTSPICDEDSTSIYYGLCVACTPLESFCSSGMVCDRNPTTLAFETCVADCRLSDAGAPCPSDPNLGDWQHCDLGSGVCLPGCVQQSDCPPQDPFCTSTGRCEVCRNGGDCPYSNPGCQFGACGGCSNASQCRPGQACSGGSCLCASAGQCGGDAPVCELASETAKLGWCGCSSSSDCASQGEVCESRYVSNASAAGACVPSCADAGTDCLLRVFPFNYCDVSTGLCATCTSDGQCVGDAGLNGIHCLDAGYCGCFSLADCPNGTACDPLFSECAPSCINFPTQCILGSVCDSRTGLCVQCLRDADCVDLAPSTAYCDNDVDAGTSCVECLDPSQCPMALPGCSSSTFSCGTCERDADCPSTRPNCMNPPGGTCN
jgi:hypothetical protein